MANSLALANEIEMTEKARNALSDAFTYLLSVSLRVGPVKPTLLVAGFGPRNGMEINYFLYDLALSLDQVPALIRAVSITPTAYLLARLDTVDGTETEWGCLAKALVDGLDLAINKQTMVAQFPECEWGFKRYCEK